MAKTRSFTVTGPPGPSPLRSRTTDWSMLCHDTRHRWCADVVETGQLGAGLSASNDAFGDLRSFTCVQLLAPSTDASLGLGGGETGGSSFPDHGAFKLGDDVTIVSDVPRPFALLEIRVAVRAPTATASVHRCLSAASHSPSA